MIQIPINLSVNVTGILIGDENLSAKFAVRVSVFLSISGIQDSRRYGAGEYLTKRSPAKRLSSSGVEQEKEVTV